MALPDRMPSARSINRVDDPSAAHQMAKFHERAVKAWKKRKRAEFEAGAAAATAAAAKILPGARQDNELIEKRMKSGNANSYSLLGGGVTKTFKVEFDNGEVGNFKPDWGEAENMRDGIEFGQQAEREAGAWEVAKIVGMDDIVAPVVIRGVHIAYDNDAEGVHSPPGLSRGALLRWWEGTPADIAAVPPGDTPDAFSENPKIYDGEHDLKRAAMFDFVIGNADRHAGNWIVKPDGSLRLLDHGLSFSEYSSDGNRLFIDRVLQGVRDGNPNESGVLVRLKDNDFAQYAKTYIENEEKIVAALEKLKLPKASIDCVRRRIAMLRDGDPRQPAEWVDGRLVPVTRKKDPDWLVLRHLG